MRAIDRLERILVDHYLASEGFLKKYFNAVRVGLFIDVGANVGEWSRFMLKRGIRTVAFEPDTRTLVHLYELQRRYANLLTVHPVALGSSNTIARFRPANQTGLSKIVLGEVGIRVNLKTLDSFGLENVSLIKIDTEGYELEVLRGAAETLKQSKPRLIIEVHEILGHRSYTDEIRDMSELLAQYSYSYVAAYKRTRQPHLIFDSLR